MFLEKYKEKRELSKISKSLKEEKNFKKNIYVIQKHSTIHPHYDLRLEFEGVLKSWAIPKIPSQEKGLKRLAIEVEDHPIDYATFEGIIPEGNYGAGKVEIWDKGNFELIEKSKDKIIIKIKGEKLNGEYCLVRTNFQGKKNNWLFFKK